MPIKSKFGHWAYTVKAKTADYTVTEQDLGTIFTTRGAAGAVNFTLPAPAAPLAGCWVKFINEADQNMVVTSGTADTLVVFNDLAADSIAFQSASERIGGAIECVVNDDGTKWLAFVHLGAETQTPTIVTA